MRRSHRMMRSAAIVGFTMAAGTALLGIHVLQETKKVPIARLVQNLERQLEQAPDDVATRLNLARLYAMAYSLKVDAFEASTTKGQLQPWFGYSPPHLPGPVRRPSGGDRRDWAADYLEPALKTYADVVSRAPDNVVARLGLAWALEQAGQKDRAIAEYRKTVELAWPVDRAKGSFWTDPVTTEAAERLEALLDPVKDARELAALAEKTEELDRKGRMITPVAVPLDGAPDGAPVDEGARVAFDADGSGLPQRWSWIRRDAAWLVYDADGSGRITSALQWFGTVTFWLFWENGYDAMRALDDDGNGELRGTELRHLALWQDVNQNGVSEPGEVRPLDAHGIVALSCRYAPGDGRTVAAVSPHGVTFAGGRTRPTYDVVLRSAGRVHTTAPSHIE